MPLFEFVCGQCKKQFTFLTGVIADNAEAQCPACGSRELQKLMSSFRRGRSDDARMEAIAEKMESRDLDSPGEMSRFAREMGRELSAESGEDLSGEIEELIEEESLGGSGSSGAGTGGGDDGTIY